MASRATVSQTAFGFYRGTDEAIHNLAAIPGAVFFTTDTEKLYFDDANGVRHSVGASGVKFVYGVYGEVLQPAPSGHNNASSTYPRSGITAAYTEMGKREETYGVDDIILNNDGSLYRIMDMDEDNCYVTLLLVSGNGSGGGGGAVSSGITVSFIEQFPELIAYGEDAHCTIQITDINRGNTARLYLGFYKGDSSLQPYTGEYVYDQRITLTNGSARVDVTVPASYLEAGTVQVRAYASVNGKYSYTKVDGVIDETSKAYSTFEVVDVKFVPSGTWDPVSIHEASDTNFTYGYNINVAGSLDAETFKKNFIQTGAISATVVVDADTAPITETYVLGNTQGALPLYELFEGLEYGTHSLDITTIMVINGFELTISTDLHYEICWYDQTEENKKPIIWSPFRRTGQIFKNYSVISIDFMVYDPESTTNDANVTYYVNDEEVSAETVRQSNQYHTWEIAKYASTNNVNGTLNTFTITCGVTTWTAEVTIMPEYGYTLEPTAGSILQLSSTGRTNNESAARRSVWNNESTISSKLVLALPDETNNNNMVDTPISLTGFNWYNNGWVKETLTADEIAAGKTPATVLRVSNGASVYIPTTIFSTAGGNSLGQTYEFDFAVHNAVDYSRLIRTEYVYETDEQGNFILDGEGNKIIKTNDTTGDKEIQRVVATDGRGAFLQYFANAEKRGIILGTQEAFLALSASKLVSARYTDDERVKVSFVITPATIDNPLVYAYINGVLTSVMSYPKNTASAEFAQSFNSNTNGQTKPGIYITSDYCDVDIYGIRIYNNALSFSDITQNWTADGETLAEKKARYEENQKILDGEGKIDYEKVKDSKLIPVMVLSTPRANPNSNRYELPFFKGNKMGCDIRYYDPIHPERSFHLWNAEINVQGTSSQGYPRRNFKFSLKTGDKNWSKEDHPFRIEAWDGDDSNKDVFEKAAPEGGKGKWDIGIGMKAKSFCLKADYMDSSSSHNTAGAMLVAALAQQYPDYDLRHPLARLIGATSPYQTSVYGYPIICFHENEQGKLTYIGKYNFNIDKSSENVFGFTDETVDPFISANNDIYVDELDEEGDAIINSQGNVSRINKSEYTFGEITECWELTNNQAGPSKFTDGLTDGHPDEWLDTAIDVINGNEIEYYTIQKHFEQRYPEMVTSDYAGEKNGGNAQEWRDRTVNLAKLWDWIRSTDVTTYKTNVYTSRPVRDINGPVYYQTLSTIYDPMVTYYERVNDEWQVKTITTITTATTKGAFISTDVKFDDNNSPNKTDYNKTDNVSAEITDVNLFIDFLKAQETDGPEQHANSEYVGEHQLIKIDGTWYYGNVEINNLTDVGITLVNNAGVDIIYLIFTIAVRNDGFTTSLYERFTKDTNRYRLCKFKNELSNHINKAYALFYFIFTEFFLLYDSRQKNMMIASWGPETVGGEYIWYPIFYDLDTQLGINNSGQIYWDYDVDATPQLSPKTVTRVIDGETVTDVDIGVMQNGVWYAATDPQANMDTIFSGNGSVLWNNMQLCFSSDIVALYKQLRKNSFTSNQTIEFYETKSSNCWSEIMKNWDAYYKYLAPATEGYRTTSSEVANMIKYTSDYYYCLQGDRSLQRLSLIRNRFNYLDSQYGAKAYDPATIDSQIKMRYNLNDKARTSDTDAIGMNPIFNSNANFTIQPYFSQYVSVVYDETASNNIKFTLGTGQNSVTINPPVSIAKRTNLGVALTQQLAYIRGPQNLSSIGDLAPKYLNELVITEADRLRELKVGDETDGYKNENLTSLTIGPKGLLQSIDLTNLTKVNADSNSSLDISGCSKLSVLKLLGTPSDKVNLPEGNVLTRVYLPATETTIKFIMPLKLRGIITNKALAKDNVAGNEGLYIENLTDTLNTWEQAADKVAFFQDSNVKSSINYYQMDDTKMGYDTYRMLNYLYNYKKYKENSGILFISASNVDWTPYIQVTVDDKYDSNATYFKRADIRYIAYTYDALTWGRDVADGLIYRLDTEKPTDPITDLSMLDYFMQALDDNSVSFENYKFRSIYTDSVNTSKKIAPYITGHIHVNNDSSHPINEAEIFVRYQATNHYPNLDITANYTTPANRAQFIEFLNDGVQSMHQFGTQKYAAGYGNSEVTYTFETPTRLHYIFGGWAIAGSGENQYTVDEWRTKVSQLEESELNALKDAGTILTNDKLNMLSLASDSYTLVAVYYKRPYTVTYMFDETHPATDYSGNVITSTAYAGEPIAFTSVVPYKDDTMLAKMMTYRFIGWTKNAVPTKSEIYYTPTNGRTVTDKDIKFYAQFEQVDVRNYPIPGTEDYWDISVNDSNSTARIGLKDTSPIQHGKICIPRVVTVGGAEYTVTAIRSYYTGSAFNTSSRLKRQFSPNAFAYNNKITHIFFEGANTNCAITTFEDAAFYGMGNLRYIELPASLETISSCALAGCTKLILSDPIKVPNIGSYAFAYINIIDAFNLQLGKPTTDDSKSILILTGDVQSIGLGAFASLGYKHVQIGTENKPISLAVLNVTGNNNGRLYQNDGNNELNSDIFANPDEARDSNGQLYVLNYRLLEDIMVYADDATCDQYLGERSLDEYLNDTSVCTFFGNTPTRVYSESGYNQTTISGLRINA